MSFQKWIPVENFSNLKTRAPDAKHLHTESNMLTSDLSMF